MSSYTVSTSSPSPSMTVEPQSTAATRVFNTMEILQQIAGYLCRDSILNIMTSSSSGFEAGLKAFWKRGSVDMLRNMMEELCPPNHLLKYCNSVKYLEFGDDVDDDPEEITEMFLRSFPHARTVYYEGYEYQSGGVSWSTTLICEGSTRASGEAASVIKGLSCICTFEEPWLKGESYFESPVELVIGQGPLLYSDLKASALVGDKIDAATALDMAKAIVDCNVFTAIRKLELNCTLPRTAIEMLVDTFGKANGSSYKLEALAVTTDLDLALLCYITGECPAIKSLCLTPTAEAKPIPLKIVLSILGDDCPMLEHLEIGVTLLKTPSAGIDERISLQDIRQPKLRFLTTAKLYIHRLPTISLFEFASYLSTRVPVTCAIRTTCWPQGPAPLSKTAAAAPDAIALKQWSSLLKAERLAVTQLSGSEHNWHQLFKGTPKMKQLRFRYPSGTVPV